MDQSADLFFANKSADWSITKVSSVVGVIFLGPPRDLGSPEEKEKYENLANEVTREIEGLVINPEKLLLVLHYKAS